MNSNERYVALHCIAFYLFSDHMLLRNNYLVESIYYGIGLLARLRILEEQCVVHVHLCVRVFVCVLYLTTIFKQCMFFPQKCAHHQILFKVDTSRV